MTYDAVGPPPSPPGYGRMTGPRDDVTGHVMARTEFSLSYVSPNFKGVHMKLKIVALAISVG